MDNRYEHMKGESLFVYDTSKGYSRFIKSHFLKKFNVECCIRRRQFNEFDLSKFQYAIIIVNQYEELVDFFKITRNVNFVISGSTIQKINFLLKDMDEIKHIDLEMMKNNTLKVIADMI